jgi:glutathione S-transferase
MALTLLFHPFSSYCQKVLIALYENGTPFEPLLLGDAAGFGRLAALWPPRKFPVLVDKRIEGERTVPEATAIIEYLEVFHPGPVTLIPKDAAQAVDVRLMDRIFDNHVHTPMQKIVGDVLRPEGQRDPTGVADAHATLDTLYAWLDTHLAGRTWAAHDQFSLADCAAGPALFYADWVHPIDERFAHLRAYRQRLLARPSFARAIDEARPYRSYFPPGAPDRD